MPNGAAVALPLELDPRAAAAKPDAGEVEQAALSKGPLGRCRPLRRDLAGKGRARWRRVAGHQHVRRAPDGGARLRESVVEAINELDVPAYIYHLGDFDLSGVNAGEKIEETLRDLAPDADIAFERIAVTGEQIADWHLPTRPTKASDTRAKAYRAAVIVAL